MLSAEGPDTSLAEALKDTGDDALYYFVKKMDELEMSITAREDFRNWKRINNLNSG